MKKVFAVSFFSFLLFYSCTEESQFQEDQTNSFNPDAIIAKQKTSISFERFELISQKMDEIKALQLNSALNKKASDCPNTVFVPDDYPTIQEGIFAVCENGNVFVRSGVYNESPGISTAGIFIKAIGDVTLNGGFGLGADNVKIHGFKIDNAFSDWGQVGIASGPGYNGFELKHNTIYSTRDINRPAFPFGHIGIYLEYCDDAKIVQNTISGKMEAGIYIDAIRLDEPGSPGHPFGSSNNNTISNNTITDIIGPFGIYYPGTCIQLRGDTDNTVVEGNYTDNSNGWGISLWSFNELGKNCDGNMVKNNIAKNNLYNGFEIFGGGSNNVLGPNNECSNNGEIGVFLSEDSTDNYVFNNSAFNNGLCDIVDLGTNNGFKINQADCTFGLD